MERPESRIESDRARWRRNAANYRLRHQLHRGECPALPALTDSQHDEAARLYRWGLTVAQVAAELGATYDQTHGALTRRGVELRPRGRKQSA